jgi:hypothetical protein
VHRRQYTFRLLLVAHAPRSKSASGLEHSSATRSVRWRAQSRADPSVVAECPLRKGSPPRRFQRRRCKHDPGANLEWLVARCGGANLDLRVRPLARSGQCALPHRRRTKNLPSFEQESTESETVRSMLYAIAVALLILWLHGLVGHRPL